MVWLLAQIDALRKSLIAIFWSIVYAIGIYILVMVIYWHFTEPVETILIVYGCIFGIIGISIYTFFTIRSWLTRPMGDQSTEIVNENIKPSPIDDKDTFTPQGGSEIEVETPIGEGQKELDVSELLSLIWDMLPYLHAQGFVNIAKNIKRNEIKKHLIEHIKTHGFSDSLFPSIFGYLTVKGLFLTSPVELIRSKTPSEWDKFIQDWNYSRNMNAYKIDIDSIDTSAEIVQSENDDVQEYENE